MFNPEEISGITAALAEVRNRLTGPNAAEHGDNWRHYDLGILLKAAMAELGQAEAHLEEYGRTRPEDLEKYATKAMGWCVLFILRVGKGKE